VFNLLVIFLGQQGYFIRGFKDGQAMKNPSLPAHLLFLEYVENNLNESC
jgi:hypothetical protein